MYIGNNLLKTSLWARPLAAVVSGLLSLPLQLAPILKPRLRRREGLGQLLPEGTGKTYLLKESDGVPQNNRVGSSRGWSLHQNRHFKGGMGRIHYFRTPGAGWTWTTACRGRGCCSLAVGGVVGTDLWSSPTPRPLSLWECCSGHGLLKPGWAVGI